MHTRAKISVTFWALAATLGAILVLANTSGWYYELEVYQATGLGIVLLVAWRLWAVRQLRTTQERNTIRRLADLQRDIRKLGRPVRIEGMPPALSLIFGVVATALLVVIYLGSEKIIFLGFAILAAIFTLIAMLVRVAKLGQPLLIISREGVQPAGYGLLPWSALYGIECHTTATKYGSSIVLNLYVPELQTYLGSAHPLIRFFRSIPGFVAKAYVDVIRIPMRKPSELPHVVERLCRELWEQSTGRTHTWSIHFSGSRAQLSRLVVDARRKLKKTPESAAALEQTRMEMEKLQRCAQLVKDEHRAGQLWTQVWTVPVVLLLAVLVSQAFGRWVGFVPTDAWSTQAFVIAVVLAIITWGFTVWHARIVFGELFTRMRLLQVLLGLGLGSILFLPMLGFLIATIGGIVATDGDRPNEEITVIATKQERTTRRGCNYVLSHPGIGQRLCLVRSEFQTYPAQVPVVLSIRRSALGYKVYEQRIALPKAEE